MGRKLLVGIVVIEFVVICALSFLLVQGRRPSPERERVLQALADIHGVLAVGANYTQFQEKVQALAGAVENFRSAGGGADDLAPFYCAQKLYKDSLDLWSDEIDYPATYESERRRFTPTVLQRIAKEQGFDLSGEGIPYKAFADQLLQELWRKADDAARGANSEKEPERHKPGEGKPAK